MRSHDLFCHGCRKSWPIEVDLAVLRDNLSLSEPIQADIPSLPAPDLPIDQGDSGQRQNGCGAGERKEVGGDRGTRTPNLGIANAALSQLSYIP